MARFNRGRQDQLVNTLLKAKRRFEGTPLDMIGKLLVKVISDIQISQVAGGYSTDGAAKIASYAASVLEQLPSSFGDRFTFDTQLIHALAYEYSQGGAKLSRMLVPKPSHAWGHQTVSMPSTDGRNAYAVDVVHLPGHDVVDEINLLDYPFICHELGHHVLFKDGEQFISSFGQELDFVLSAMQKQMLGIRGPARQIASATVNQVKQYWMPSADQFNWAHEIAVDVIAIWLCGPAYLAAIQDVMESDDLNPFQLGQSHPPYETRGRALIEAAERLGWAYYTGPFLTLIDHWSKSPKCDEKTNLNVACADPRLISAAVSAALEACEALSLPCCTVSRVTEIENAVRDGREIEIGTDVLIAAWSKHSHSNGIDYDAWEKATIARLLAEITE